MIAGVKIDLRQRSEKTIFQEGKIQNELNEMESSLKQSLPEVPSFVPQVLTNNNSSDSDIETVDKNAIAVAFVEETNFSILSRLRFNFKGFCSRMSFGIVHYFFFAFGVLILSYFVLFDGRKV